MNIIDIDYNNSLHRKCIFVLSKKNKFHVYDLYNNYDVYKNDANYKGFFICEGKKPVGYLLYFIRDGNLVPNSNEQIDLLFILIEKNKRNNGYGTILVEHLQKKYNENMIIVRIDNNSLEKWYNKNKFYVVNEAIDKCITPENKAFIIIDSEIHKSAEIRMYYMLNW
jgi:ribosomal protein S18 acetylase RimI-like enzyme